MVRDRFLGSQWLKISRPHSRAVGWDRTLTGLRLPPAYAGNSSNAELSNRITNHQPPHAGNSSNRDLSDRIYTPSSSPNLISSPKFCAKNGLSTWPLQRGGCEKVVALRVCLLNNRLDLMRPLVANRNKVCPLMPDRSCLAPRTAS